MKTPIKLTAIIISSLLLVVLIVWLSGAFNEKIAPGKLDRKPVEISGDRYTIESITEDTMETATGNINAREETSVSSRLLATIHTISVRAGDTIRKNDKLIELDDRELKAMVEQVKQSVVAAKAGLNETEAEYNRVNALYEQQVVSRAEFDRVDAALKTSQANYQRSQQQLQEAQTALSFTTINSPIDGKVIERFAEPGDTAAPGKPLIKIYNPSLLRLDAQVRESLAAKINIGDTLYATIDAINNKLPVIVDEIVPSADPGSRSITVKVLLPTDVSLFPGMFGRLLVPMGNTEKIYIPSNSISRLGQLEIVKVLEDGMLSKRYIRTGYENKQGQIEVLSGLQVGETIVVPVR
jgi:RND family efflux transporter MFP subunit